MSILDKEFDAEVLAQLNEKLAEAAKVMKEVNALRDKLGLDSLILTVWARDDFRREIRSQIDDGELVVSDHNEMYELLDEKMDAAQARYDQIDTGPLERELNNAGWSTSSSYC